MTTIGIIGSGHVGSNIARAAIAHGYTVVLSNSQPPDALSGLVGELGPEAKAATPAEAAPRAISPWWPSRSLRSAGSQSSRWPAR